MRQEGCLRGTPVGEHAQEWQEAAFKLYKARVQEDEKPCRAWRRHEPERLGSQWDGASKREDAYQS